MRLRDHIAAEIERAAVMRAEHEETDVLRGIFLEDIPDCKEIAGGFRHLLVIDIDESVVQPITGERLSGSTF